MERLVGPGYSYAHFSSKSDYIRECTVEAFQTAIEEGNIRAAYFFARRLEQYVRKKKPETKQLYMMAIQICENARSVDWRRNLEVCLEILQLRRPNVKWEEGALLVGHEIHIDRGRIDIVCTDWVELWTLNNMALSFMHLGELGMALEILAFINMQTCRDNFVKKRSGKARASINNNIALCLLQMDEWSYAKRYVEKAVEVMFYEGGIGIYAKILRVKMEVEKSLGEIDEYYRVKDRLKCISPDLRFEVPEGMGIEEYLWEHREIVMF